MQFVFNKAINAPSKYVLLNNPLYMESPATLSLLAEIFESRKDLTILFA